VVQGTLVQLLKEKLSSGKPELHIKEKIRILKLWARTPEYQRKFRKPSNIRKIRKWRVKESHLYHTRHYRSRYKKPGGETYTKVYT